MQSFLDPEKEQIRDEANAWIARFAPLVMSDQVPTEVEVRQRISDCVQLGQQGAELQNRLSSISDDEPDLISTFQKALGQLGSLESDFRKQLARLKPGDPDGIADLNSINEKLAERLARQEVGLDTAQEVPDILEMKVAPGNKAAAAGLGVFGLGWNAFTAFHATMMIGGMSKAFGWAALFMLAFYAIFFFAGIGMWISAFNAGSEEYISLEGRKLTVTRKLGPWVRERHYTLASDCVADIAEMQIAQVNSNQTSKRPTPVVQMFDTEGNPIGIGANATDVQRRQTRDRINAYLRLKG